MRIALWCAVLAIAGAANAAAAGFATVGGPAPANVDEIAAVLRQHPYDLELLLSYGTSKGGSAGHLALAIRDPAGGDDLVYSANFYADREPGHAVDFYNDELMIRIPKKEYLFGTSSSVSAKASFGLDFGEIYKRSVIGVRVHGVPAREKEALAAYFARINDDFRRRARDTEYHDGEVKYDYLRLNCAKTIGSAFRYGAGYGNLGIDSARFLSGRPVVAALNANIPTEMALKLMREWNGIDLGRSARRGPDRLQGPAQPVPLGPVARLPPRAGRVRGRGQPVRDVPALQPGSVQRARERTDPAARDRPEQGPDALRRGREARRAERPVGQRQLWSARRVRAAGPEDRASRRRQRPLGPAHAAATYGAPSSRYRLQLFDAPMPTPKYTGPRKVSAPRNTEPDHSVPGEGSPSKRSVIRPTSAEPPT